MDSAKLDPSNQPFVTFNNGEKYPSIGFGSWAVLDAKTFVTAIEMGYR